MEVADVDDDDADEYFKADTGDEHGKHEVIEAMAVTPNVEQQLELGDLGQGEDGHEGDLGLRLWLLQLAVPREQLWRNKGECLLIAYNLSYVTCMGCQKTAE